MADQPYSLVLRLLRDIRATQHEHTARFERLEDQLGGVRRQAETAAFEGTFAVGYAAQVGFGREEMRHDISELRSEVDDVKRRLTRVEDEGR